MPTPGKVRDGRWLVGMGMASAFRNNINMKSAARVRLERDGTLTVETDMTDIGTGSYTIIAQTAAEMMGLPIERVDVRLGDSDFPVSAGLRRPVGRQQRHRRRVRRLRQAARTDGAEGGPGSGRGGIRGRRGAAGGRGTACASWRPRGEIAAEDTMEYGDLDKKFQQSTFGAHFVEVGVDVATAEIRVRRMLAVCAAGRILNPKSARSQVIGAMTMGVGGALMEDLVVDKRIGYFVNHDLAGYEVPVHADIPHQEVVFLDETDPMCRR
jgi:xanthine dehydrogenase YagR molybdenum-binding subunit